LKTGIRSIASGIEQNRDGDARTFQSLIDVSGAPGMIRTCDPLIRSQVLYPAELRVRAFLVNSKW
jgi:hypothetical protein